MLILRNWLEYDFLDFQYPLVFQVTREVAQREETVQEIQILMLAEAITTKNQAGQAGHLVVMCLGMIRGRRMIKTFVSELMQTARTTTGQEVVKHALICVKDRIQVTGHFICVNHVIKINVNKGIEQ